jgi:hypothetical protein
MSDMSRLPTPPPAPDHERHDALLVAQLAAGDPLEEPQRREATQLVAGCPACAALVSDLQLISGVVAREPVPPRRRDFRLNPEQAEQLQGHGLGRWLRRLSLPQARAFQPAAVGLLSVGLVFVVAGYAWPDDGSLSVSTESNAVAPLVEQRSGAPAPSPVLGKLATPSIADDAAMADSAVGEGSLAAPSEAFLEELSEHQAGTSARSTQKSLRAADKAEAMELGRLAAPEAPAAAVGVAELEAGFADVAAPEDLEVADELESTVTAAQDSDGAGVIEVDAGEPKVADVEATLEDDSAAEALIILLGVALAVAGGLLLLLGWLSRRTVDPLLR